MSLCSCLSTLAAEAAPRSSAPKSVKSSSEALESGPMDLSTCLRQVMDRDTPNCWDLSAVPKLKDSLLFQLQCLYTAILLWRAKTAFSSQSHALVCFVSVQGLVSAVLGFCEVTFVAMP